MTQAATGSLFDPAFWLTTGASALLLVLSAFFSGSETALTAASRPRMHNLAQSGNHRADLVNRLWHEKEHLIGAILLGNNLVTSSPRRWPPAPSSPSSARPASSMPPWA